MQWSTKNENNTFTVNVPALLRASKFPPIWDHWHWLTVNITLQDYQGEHMNAAISYSSCMNAASPSSRAWTKGIQAPFAPWHRLLTSTKHGPSSVIITSVWVAPLVTRKASKHPWLTTFWNKSCVENEMYELRNVEDHQISRVQFKSSQVHLDLQRHFHCHMLGSLLNFQTPLKFAQPGSEEGGKQSSLA